MRVRRGKKLERGERGGIPFNCSVMELLLFSQEQSFLELNRKSSRQAGADKNVAF